MNQFSAIKAFAYTVLIEVRNTSVWLSACIIFLLALLIGLFVAEISLVEIKQSQLGICAGFLRLAILFFLSLLTINSIIREKDDRLLLLYCGLPYSRSLYVLGKYSGFLLLAACMILPAIVLFISFGSDWMIAGFWLISLFTETAIVIAFSLVCSLGLNHVTSAFSAVVAFYLFSRLLPGLIMIYQNPLRSTDGVSHQFMNGFLNAIRYLLPDSTAFSKAEWLMYESVSFTQINQNIMEAVIYSSLLLSVACIDFYRKNI